MSLQEDFRGKVGKLRATRAPCLNGIGMAICYRGFRALANTMGFPFLDGEQAIVNKAREEKERLNNEPFTEVWNRKLKIHFVPEHDKCQLNVLLLSRNPIPPK
jgi:hypothetical protein